MFEKICALIAKQLDVEPSSIKPESSLIDDLHADSLDIVELVMDVEQEFDVEITDDALPKMKTVADVLAFLEQK